VVAEMTMPEKMTEKTASMAATVSQPRW